MCADVCNSVYDAARHKRLTANSQTSCATAKVLDGCATTLPTASRHRSTRGICGQQTIRRTSSPKLPGGKQSNAEEGFFCGSWIVHFACMHASCIVLHASQMHRCTRTYSLTHARTHFLSLAAPAPTTTTTTHAHIYMCS